MGRMTYDDLFTHLLTLTPEQRMQTVKWYGDERGGFIGSIHILEEDYIDPSGDGMEPASVYADQPEVFEAPSSFAPKGTVFLVEEEEEERERRPHADASAGEPSP